VIGRSRAEKKAAAVLRAELALRHAFERIDYDEDVIKPKLLEIRALEDGNVIEVTPELEVGDALHGLA
jgi:hypothetical protein